MLYGSSYILRVIFFVPLVFIIVLAIMLYCVSHCSLSVSYIKDDDDVVYSCEFVVFEIE